MNKFLAPGGDMRGTVGGDIPAVRRFSWEYGRSSESIEEYLGLSTMPTKYLTKPKASKTPKKKRGGKLLKVPTAAKVHTYRRDGCSDRNLDMDMMGRMSPIEYCLKAGVMTPEGYASPSGRMSPQLAEELEDGRLSSLSGYVTPIGGRCSPTAPLGSGASSGLLGYSTATGLETSAQAEGLTRRRQYEESERLAGRVPDSIIASRLEEGQELYPNCHVEIWLRSCKSEIEIPIAGVITGTLPPWLRGTLIRNGPGSLEVGDDTFKHLFDGAALLQRFCIQNGQVTYQCRFLRSQTWCRNAAAQRIVVTEFGTRAAPDPCQTIFKRVAAMFYPGEALSDNAMISVYPIGDEFFAFTESPVMTRIDPVSLQTLDRVNVFNNLGIVNHTSHPLVLNDGSAVNLGLSLSATGPKYTLIHFPSEQKTDGAFLSGSVPARWPLHPGYMHSFGMTASYWVLVEQPMSVSVPAIVRSQLSGEPTAATLRWFPDHPTLIHLVQRSTGRHTHTFLADPFFFLHVINCYERPSLDQEESGGVGEVVVDICCYRDPAMLSCMYIDALKDAQRNPDYARLFRGRPQRFVLPLSDSGRRVRPQLLCSLGCETPRINAERYLGRPYRYFYAISSDVDHENPGTLIKVDTWTCTCQTWGEPGVYPSEPIFVASPNAQYEDEGVVVCALVWAHDEHKAGLLVVDACTWTEVARAEFATPSPVPKCLHGWFAQGLV